MMIYLFGRLFGTHVKDSKLVRIDHALGFKLHQGFLESLNIQRNQTSIRWNDGKALI